VGGIAPAPRCAHSAIFITKYIAIFGGKAQNDVLSMAYSDLFLFNIEQCSWEEVVVFGFKPICRYGHTCI